MRPARGPRLACTARGCGCSANPGERRRILEQGFALHALADLACREAEASLRASMEAQSRHSVGPYAGLGECRHQRPHRPLGPAPGGTPATQRSATSSALGRTELSCARPAGPSTTNITLSASKQIPRWRSTSFWRLPTRHLPDWSTGASTSSQTTVRTRCGAALPPRVGTGCGLWRCATRLPHHRAKRSLLRSLLPRHYRRSALGLALGRPPQ